MKKIWEKAVVIFVLIAFLFNFSGFLFLTPAPKKAEAGWPVSVLADIPAFLKWAWDKAQVYWEKLDKKYRDAVVRIVIAKMQMDIINKINGGGGGYVNDWNDYLKDSVMNVAFNQVNDYVAQASGGNVDLCVPYAQQFLALRIMSLGLAQGVGNPYYDLPVRCSFDEFKQNLNNTYDFVQRGGWAAYDASFDPGVDPAWISWSAKGTFYKVAAEKEQQKQTEALSSSGYVGARNSNGEVITPGDALAKAVMEALGADFQYAANVQTALGLVVNAFIGKILREGLASGASSGTDTYQINLGDLNGTGFEGYTKDEYSQDLKDAQQTYSDTLSYLDDNLIPANNLVLQLIKDKNLESCSSTLPTVQIDEGNGNQTTYTVSDLITLIKGFDAMFAQAKQDAETNGAVIEGLLASDTPQESDIIKALNDLTAFTKTYNNISQDVQLVNGGQDGTLMIVLRSVYKALSDSAITCSQ